SPSAAHTEGEETRDYSSRPSTTPAGGRVTSDVRLSSSPISPPSTKTAAVPSTISSGVEYFMGRHLLSFWDSGGAPPMSSLQPVPEAKHTHPLGAGPPASIEYLSNRVVDLSWMDPAALHDFETFDRAR